MKRTLRWSLILAAGVLLAFIVRLPAALALRALPDTVSLAGVQGSLWNGSASALGIDGVLAQEKLVWQLEPAALLRGALVWQLRSEQAGQPGSARIMLGLGKQALEALDMRLPLEAISRFDPTLAGVRLGGSVQVLSPSLARQAPVELTLRLEQVSSSMAAEPTVLGSYLLAVKADAAGAGTLQASTLGGALRIDGGGSFQLAQQAIDITLRLKPEGDLPGLASLLATLPREGEHFVLAVKRP